MAGKDERDEAPLDLIRRGFDALPAWVAQERDEDLGPVAIQLREFADRSEAVSSEVLRRFDRSGAWRADGALNIVSWLRWKGKLTGGAAMERVSIARQLHELPKTEAAFERGDLGYQHVAAIARTAENVGVAAVRKAEATLLEAARTHDPGQFVAVAKNLEHEVDQEAALREANRAHSRRYFHISEPDAGMVRLDGILDAEGGAVLKTTLDALMPPPAKDDDRTAGQRRADALVDLARHPLDGSKLASTGGQRPHLVITASAETLAGLPGAPAPHLEGIGPIPVESAQRFACDATVSWLLAQAELESETSHAHRRIPPSTRRALVARDRHCVFPGCQRPVHWCDGHHLVWWTRGGETVLANLALVCGRHHRMLHEEGWRLERKDGRWVAISPAQAIAPSARSA